MVIVVMGVSGSGKTDVGGALARRLGWVFEDADNWHPASNIGNAKRRCPDRRGPGALASIVEQRRPKWIADKRDVVLACSALRTWHRNALRDGVPDRKSVRLVYLKGTYEAIDRRLRLRVGHFVPESLLESQFATLEEPGASEALVVDFGQAVASVVDSIVTASSWDRRSDWRRGENCRDPKTN